MQIELYLCIGTLYQFISFTGADESDNESKSRDDNYVLAISSTEKNPNIRKKKIEEGADELNNESKSREDNYVLAISPTEKHPNIRKKKIEEDKEYEAEKKLGDMTSMLGTNQHFSYPDTYKDLNRRFVLQYPYKEVSNANEDEEAETNFDNTVKDFQDNNQLESHLIPVKAPPELVMAVAAKAALIEASYPKTSMEENSLNKEILRSGNYWNDVWREDVHPNILRTQENKVQPLKVKIMPNSKLYKLVSALKKISPRLVYVINEK